ncbi:hypothetical protein FBU59_003466 [Linderina macrospora]|uniref:Uncharacterized protein n=1 Tax=Linderina macrospora TaxID=4868 RepID=A0ACC1J854_9FUNG|nr:hypothetical protein FBU59_003466 [Linderina macrospora]
MLMLIFSSLLAATVMFAADPEISIVMSLSSTVWVPGQQGAVSFRYTGQRQSYEIDLIAGEADSVQLMHVFGTQAEPMESGFYSVMVDMPSDIPDGSYAVRVGMPDGGYWAYSQAFSISASGESKNGGVNIGSGAMLHSDLQSKAPALTETNTVSHSTTAQSNAPLRHPGAALGAQIAMGAILAAMTVL